MHDTDRNFRPNCYRKTVLADGSILLESEQSLGAFSEKLTKKLVYWADKTPDQLFIARRDTQSGTVRRSGWTVLTYSETLRQVERIAQYLLNQEFSSGQTIAILSENSLEHALLALAALHIGIPYSPISPAYSLVSNDFEKLTHTLLTLTPKLIFVQNESVYSRALAVAKSFFSDAVLVSVDAVSGVSFAELLATQSTEAVQQAHRYVTADTVAKILFTSGSTGSPKGVINTHRMWCANLQQITQAFPCLATEPPVFVDWLPWNHTFGGNHNFGLTLYNGGTLYIDDGKPTPKRH